MTRARPARLSIRTRLSLLYGGALFAAGALQLAAMYAIVRYSLFQPIPPNPPGMQTLPQRQIPPGAMEIIDDFRNNILRDLLTQSAIALIIIGVIASVLGWLLAGRALAPIHQIANTAARVSSGALNERIALQGPRDEVRELADTFDAMLDRLEHAFDAQQRFVANASHELRTPLAIERTILEVALADPGASPDLTTIGNQILDVHARSERVIDGLLTLARGEQAHAQEPVDLAEIAASAVAVCDREAQAQNITISTELAAAPVTGDPDLLDRLVLNLVQNAIRYNTPDGWLTITTCTDHHTGAPTNAKLGIENPGPVIAAADIDALFQPFRRGQDRTGNGTGLGLSISRTITNAHNGQIEAFARPQGGLRIEVSLPVDAKD